MTCGFDKVKDYSPIKVFMCRCKATAGTTKKRKTTMNKITELNRALPMVASVLGKKYGVQVEIGGNTACTDGKVIRLPTLPLESDEKMRNMTRGFLDHESAHIRETDFDVLQDKDLTPLIKNIWNIFEDWRVENELAKRFPGCRTNLHWLIEHEFTKKMKKA